MVVLYFLLGIAAVLIGWMLVDIIIALTKKPIPDLPKEHHDSSGLTMLYQVLPKPDSIPGNVTIDEKFIAECLKPTVDYINTRYDCADFGLLFLLRFYLEYKDLLPESNKATIKSTFLNFKYWIDEPGKDSMCYWSENHQLMFAVCEYLAGREWAQEIFTNSGMTGEEHRKKALVRINIWLEQRFNFGFSEWYSNNYYAEDISPMANYIQFSDDKDSVERMKIVFDILWFDVATHSVNNTFVASSSRMYGGNKSSDKGGNSIKDEMKVIWKNATTETLNEEAGESTFNINGVEFKLKLCGQMTRNFSVMYEAGCYKVPEVIRKIGEDKIPAVIKASSGLSVDDMEQEGLIGQDVGQIMAQLGAETFTNHKVIENTLQFIAKNKMFCNTFVNPFKYLDIKLLRLLRVPEALSKHFTLMTNGIALGRGNVYFYRTPNYSLSTAVAQNVDACGAQGHIWTANLAPDLTLYTTQPSRDDDSDAKHGESPGYWIGNGRQPMSVQDENINITIYKIPKKKRLLEFRIAGISHAFVPKNKYDKLEIMENRMFGQKGSVLIAMIANGSLEYRPYEKKGAEAVMGYEKAAENAEEGKGREFDLVRQGGEFHTYVTELSDTDTESFEEFKERITKNTANFNDGTVEYKSKGRTYSVGYEKTFLINGEKQPLEYERFDSRYSLAQRKADTITIQYGNEKLILDLKNIRREVIR
jgi:hypothetical protein